MTLFTVADKQCTHHYALGKVFITLILRWGTQLWEQTNKQTKQTNNRNSSVKDLYVYHDFVYSSRQAVYPPLCLGESVHNSHSQMRDTVVRTHHLVSNQHHQSPCCKWLNCEVFNPLFTVCIVTFVKIPLWSIPNIQELSVIKDTLVSFTPFGVFFHLPDQ